MIGTVAAIHVAPDSEARPEPVDGVEAVAGRGLRGDRYFTSAGTFVDDPPDERPSGHDLTLIESEAIAALDREADIALRPGAHRRNVTTAGIALDHLVGDRFRAGDAVCRGIRLCEPCSHLEGLTEAGVLDGLVHRGGLRADVIESGEVAVGDDIARV